MADHKRSPIIDHTTTCPYCGHRLLHKNLSIHIRNQHLLEAQIEKLAHEIDANGQADCPYCHRIFNLHELDEHVKVSHTLVYRKAIELVAKKEKLERARKRARRKYTKSTVGSEPTNNKKEYDLNSPMDGLVKQGRMRETDYSNPNKPRRDQQDDAPTVITIIPCEICGVPLNPKRVEKHMRKVHSNEPKHIQLKDVSNTGLQEASTIDRSSKPVHHYVFCEYCDKPVIKSKLVEHVRQYHSHIVLESRIPETKANLTTFTPKKQVVKKDAPPSIPKRLRKKTSTSTPATEKQGNKIIHKKICKICHHRIDADKFDLHMKSMHSQQETGLTVTIDESGFLVIDDVITDSKTEVESKIDSNVIHHQPVNYSSIEKTHVFDDIKSRASIIPGARTVKLHPKPDQEVKCPICFKTRCYKGLFDHISQVHQDQNAKSVMAKFNRDYERSVRQAQSNANSKKIKTGS